MGASSVQGYSLSAFCSNKPCPIHRHISRHLQVFYYNNELHQAATISPALLIVFDIMYLRWYEDIAMFLGRGFDGSLGVVCCRVVACLVSKSRDPGGTHKLCCTRLGPHETQCTELHRGGWRPARQNYSSFESIKAHLGQELTVLAPGLAANVTGGYSWSGGCLRVCS